MVDRFSLWASFVEKKVRLFVRSVKRAVGSERWSRWGLFGGPGPKGGYRLIPDLKVYLKIKYEHVLPEDQKVVAELAEEIAGKHGIKLEIIDVTKESVVKRFVQEKIEKVQVFPTLISNLGERIEGNITKNMIESLLSRRVNR